MSASSGLTFSSASRSVAWNELGRVIRVHEIDGILFTQDVENGERLQRCTVIFF